MTLIKGYQIIDPELCRPQVRAHVERQLDLVAKGLAEKDAVVAHSLMEFTQKFHFFVSKIARMDTLFELSFSPLSSSGFIPCKTIHAFTVTPCRSFTLKDFRGGHVSKL